MIRVHQSAVVAEPVAGEQGAHVSGIRAGDSNLLIDHGSVEDFGNDIAGILQRLEAFDSRKVFRNNLHDFHSRHFFLQAASNARNRATGSDPGNKVRHLSFRLRQDLRCRRFIVR